MSVLTAEEINANLAKVPGWSRHENKIVREFKFSRFAEGIEFVREVAEIADALDHHPDIDIRYTTITLAVTSHDVDAITERDFALATRVNDLV